MTTRYHIAKNGSIARCTASVRGCPLGGQHWNSKAEAMLHAQPLDIPEQLATSALKKFLNSDSLSKNESYANFIRSYVKSDDGSAPLVKAYHSSLGEFVSRVDMVNEINGLTEKLANETDYVSYASDKEVAAQMKRDLYHADYAVLSARKASFHEAYAAYREENGPVVRPNFQQLVADAKAAKDAKVEQAAEGRRQFWENEEAKILERRASEAKSARQQLARVQGSKRLRSVNEDVAISFGKSHRDEDDGFFGEQVPAVALGSALGEFVTEGKESISDFFADAGDGVRSLFHRS